MNVKAESVESAGYLIDVDIKKLEFYETTGFWSECGHAVAQIDATFVRVETMSLLC